MEWGGWGGEEEWSGRVRRKSGVGWVERKSGVGWVGRKSGVGSKEGEWSGRVRRKSGEEAQRLQTLGHAYLDLSVAPLQVPNQGESLPPC